jgi:hypothetical protein
MADPRTEEELAAALANDASVPLGVTADEYTRAFRQVQERSRALDPPDQMVELALFNSRILTVLALRAATKALADCDVLLAAREPEEAEDCSLVVVQLLDIAERADRLADKILTASGR